jgi:hypothetical protein
MKRYDRKEMKIAFKNAINARNDAINQNIHDQHLGTPEQAEASYKKIKHYERVLADLEDYGGIPIPAAWYKG